MASLAQPRQRPTRAPSSPRSEMGRACESSSGTELIGMQHGTSSPGRWRPPHRKRQPSVSDGTEHPARSTPRATTCIGIAGWPHAGAQRAANTGAAVASAGREAARRARCRRRRRRGARGGAHRRRACTGCQHSPASRARHGARAAAARRPRRVVPRPCSPQRSLQRSPATCAEGSVRPRRRRPRRRRRRPRRC